MKTTTVRFVLLVVLILSVFLSACGNDGDTSTVTTTASEMSQTLNDTNLEQGGCPDGYHVTKSNKCRNNDAFKSTDVIPMP